MILWKPIFRRGTADGMLAWPDRLTQEPLSLFTSPSALPRGLERSRNYCWFPVSLTLKKRNFNSQELFLLKKRYLNFHNVSHKPHPYCCSVLENTQKAQRPAHFILQVASSTFLKAPQVMLIKRPLTPLATC